MNIFKLSAASLRYNQVSNIFNILILAFGIAIIITLIQVSDQIERRFEKDLAGIDLVVGAKGSPIQLILSSVFHIDIPNGNILLSDARKLEKNPFVKSYIPLALGDNYQGFRIVGTTPDYPRHYGAALASGNYWKKEMQAVLGSEVARRSELQVGQKFYGAHGLTEGGEEHKEFPYQVTGILTPTGTVIDRLVFTDVGSVWYIHEHHHDGDKGEDDEKDGKNSKGKKSGEKDKDEKEITSLLITYTSPLAVASLPRLINKTSSMQAASPAFEMARLIKMLGVGGDAIQMFGAALIVIAAAGFFITLFNAVSDRKYDIALLRVLGATRGKVFAFVLAEGMTLGITGTLFGIVFGHVFSYAVQHWIETTKHLSLGGTGFHSYELWCGIIAVAVSVIASVIPAAMAYRVNVAKVLSKGA